MSDALEEFVRSEVSRLSGQVNLDDNAELLADLGMDSISLIQLVVAIEQELGIELLTDDALRCASTANLIAVCRKKLDHK